jgi:predicted nucleic acid-binding protein
MPVQLLGQLPAGSPVVVDANIFVYAANATSNQCVDLRERCARRDVRGVTTFEALAEVNHRLMLEDAVAAGIIQRGNASNLRRLRKSIPNLKVYWPSVEKIFGMNLMILELDELRFRRAQFMRERHGLLTNDSLILAAADSYGITSLATRDDDFDDVQWLTVYKPGDIP